ncbi:MAG: hypothetical protein R3F39_10770 [Myxococcota bacterium]
MSASISTHPRRQRPVLSRLASVISLGAALSLGLAACDDGGKTVLLNDILDTAPTPDSVTPDAAGDTTEVTPTPDVQPDTAPDVPAADVTPEVTPDVPTPDATPDAVADAPMPDATPDIEPEIVIPPPVAPTVVSVTPPEGGVAESATKPDIRVLFDQPMDLTVTDGVQVTVKKAADEPESYVKIAEGSSANEIIIKLDLPPFLNPGETYRARVSGLTSKAGLKMEGEYTWTFSIKGPDCGNGTCGAGESMCNCPKDCGVCAGCCEWKGGNNYSCESGKEKSKCGSGGKTCGVCEGTDQCINGKGCG